MDGYLISIREITVIVQIPLIVAGSLLRTQTGDCELP
jgi:hypothetical protein